MMPETPPLDVDFTRSTDVLPLLPRQPLRSSKTLSWKGIYVQQHYQPAWETPEHTQRCHTILIHTGKEILQTERMFDGERQQELLGGDNNVVLIPALVPHQANWYQDRCFSLLFLDPEYLTEATQVTATDRVELSPCYAMSDPFIEQIGRSLIAELEFDRIGSRLFANSLAIALSIHLLRHYSSYRQPLHLHTGGLSSSKLRQAIDYIDTHFSTNLTMSEIATELAIGLLGNKG